MALSNSSFVVDVPPHGVPVKTVRDALAIAEGHLQGGDFPRAEQAYADVLKIAPYSAEAWFFLGLIRQQHEKFADAARHYEHALRLAPRFPEARNNLGVALQELGRIDEAEACFREALRLDPDYVEAHNNLGNALQDQGRLAEAEAAYRQALLRRPGYIDALHHLGNALGGQGRAREAVECYEEVLRLEPDHGKVHLCRAMAWLQSGDYIRGWAEYEWRLKCKGQSIPPMSQPFWGGEPLDGRTILILAEQGLGDTLQFIRYATLVAKRGGRVIVACRQPLERIVASCPGVERVISEKMAVPEFDCYAPLLSLPRVFRTSLESVPAEVPYLAADPALVARWRDELGPIGGFKVGVVWQGNPDHSKDRERSFRLAQLGPLARVPGVRLFSLQKGPGSEQLGEVEVDFPITDLGRRLDDLVVTAAVMRSLDLVVSPDTSPAHLAGALGVPVWLALPAAPDWRWLRGRDDSPWYPTMLIFRQRKWGDWEDVLERMARELETHRATKHVDHAVA
jgi:Tfp pilus assembly protein PilF